MFPVILLLHRRPDYTRQVMDALAGCEGVHDHDILVHIDQPADESRMPAFLATVAAAARHPLGRKQIRVAPRPLGCTRSVLAAFEWAFSVADYAGYLEDDTVPAADCLTFFRFGREYLAHRPHLFSAGAYSRHQGDPVGWRIYNGFSCWGFATRRDRWARVVPDVAARSGAPSDPSWDAVVSDVLRDHGFSGSVTPVVSRTQNIGARDGTYLPSAGYHREFHHTPHWAGDGRDLHGGFASVTQPHPPSQAADLRMI